MVQRAKAGQNNKGKNIMQVILHTGVECTDDDRLLKSLLHNKDRLHASGVAVPGPGKYRKLLRDTMNAMAKAPPGDDAREVLLDEILDGDVADTVILSNSQFFGTWRTALVDGEFYNLAPERIAYMRQLFPNDQLEIFMAIRNPATFLPAMFEKSDVDDFSDFLKDTDPYSLCWSRTLTRMRQMAPDIPITVWCNEDTPLIWTEILREITATDESVRLKGAYDLLGAIMSREGLRRLRHYLNENRDITGVQRRRVIAAFLDKFALEDEIEEELDLPGWTNELIEDLTDIYDEDVLEIRRIPGINVITP